MELTLENISEQDTARIGKSIAPLLFPGAFIALFGDLGSGCRRGVGHRQYTEPYLHHSP